MILTQIIEFVSMMAGTGFVGFRLGKNRGQKAAKQVLKPEANLKELEEVESFLNPYREPPPKTQKQLEKKVPVQSGPLPRFPWKWEEWDKKNNKGGFRCPKCQFGNEMDGTHHPAYCNCEPPEHFHFTCKTCKVKAMINTADIKT